MGEGNGDCNVRIIGIDPGSKCGWCIIDGDAIQSGTWDLSSKRHEGGGMRYVRLARYLSELFDSSHAVAVYYEEVRRHLGTDAAHIYGGIVAMIAAECERRKIPYGGIPVGTVKKRATGKGNADKEKMLAAANLNWPGCCITDDNEADARWIAVCGKEGFA